MDMRLAHLSVGAGCTCARREHAAAGYGTRQRQHGTALRDEAGHAHSPTAESRLDDG
jgi:hypothetical protein